VNPTRTSRRLGIGRFEVAVGLLLAAVSCAMLADSLQLVMRTGGVVWGADSPIVGDTAQYLGLVRDASHGLLAGNPFDLRPDAGGVLHPGWVATGLLTRLGLPASLALLAFKPVAVAVMFLGAHLYTRRLFGSTLQRRAALLLALFALSPVLAGVIGVDIIDRGAVPVIGSVPRQFISISRELWPVSQLWGYYWAGITVGLMPLVLLAYERGRQGSRRALALAALGAALCAWLHPWQGATVLLVLAAVEATGALRRRDLRRRLASLVPVLVVGAAPLAYFAVLNRVDQEYRALGILLDGGFWRPYVIAAALLPLGVPALLAYRLPARDFQQAAVRWWLPVALFVYVQPAGTFRDHAVEGLGLPLAVLAVTGVAGLGLEGRVPALRDRVTRHAAVLAAVALFCLPGLAAELLFLHKSVTSETAAPRIAAGEADALRALDADPGAGGVLAPLPISLLVPGLTGREIWSSGLVWTPNPYVRSLQANRLFSGELAPAEARQLVRESGARFLLSGCTGPNHDLRPALGRLVANARDYGCARVYRVRG
jgi:hypothetical protein